MTCVCCVCVLVCTLIISVMFLVLCVLIDAISYLCVLCVATALVIPIAVVHISWLLLTFFFCFLFMLLHVLFPFVVLTKVVSRKAIDSFREACYCCGS